ncbi:tRNA dimethylallyltransferase [Choristoneura fumiferana]|uniref:tRNA dimethylallyltransferase n=1 Tax=Choristoneura fumiferana TaxID=7141 RepID=UPI003D15EEA2
MAFRSAVGSKLPLVIIMGATGTGKTKLSLELAQKFQTEIISADSMQVYKGLDVVTAKASPAERELVRHHLVDVLEPHQRFTVVDFRNRTLKIIQELTDKGKVPIIAGGTSYYIESIVFHNLVEGEDNSDELLWDKSIRKREIDAAGPSADEPACKKAANSPEDNDNGVQVTNDPITIEITDEFDQERVKYEMDHEHLLTNEQIHRRLMTIDPVQADKLHHNNRRKVLRSIEVWQKTGRRHSDILEEQKLTEGLLRRPGATVMLWLKCEESVLEERLDARVADMMEKGLVKELLDFHDTYNKQRLKNGTEADYTKGVFQSLGFKEFHKYLIMGEEQRQTEEGQKLLHECIEAMKLGTKRFARRQTKNIVPWFLERDRRHREVPAIYELDATDLSEWDTQVKGKAIHIIQSYLNQDPCPFYLARSRPKEDEAKPNPFGKHHCEVCQKIIIGDNEMKIHLNSNKHKKTLQRRKLEENTETIHRSKDN